MLYHLFLLLICFFCCSFGSAICSVADFGAVGDGQTINTAAIQRALDTVSCNTVVVPPGGNFLSGPVNLTRSNFVFLVQGNLSATMNASAYNVIPHLPSYPCDRDICSSSRYQPFVLLFNVTNVTVGGTGVIDGNGAYWWQMFHAQTLRYGRPRLFETMYSNGIVVEDLTLLNSGFWTTHFYASKNIIARRLTIRAPHKSPNTDGIDPDSSSNVHIHDVSVENGDDCIAIKSGLDEAGRAFGVPTTNVLIERLSCANGNGVAIGSEMSGGVSNILVRDVRLNMTSDGAIIKFSRLRGGYVRNVTFTNFTSVFLIREAITIRSNYGNPWFGWAYPKVSDITFNGFSGPTINAGTLSCLSARPCTNVNVDNVNLKVSDKGFSCQYVSGSSQNVNPKFCY